MAAFQRNLGTATNGASGLTLALTTTAVVNPYEDVVLWIGTNNITATISSVTDNAGGATNTYSVVQTATGTTRLGYIVVCQNSKLLPIGTTFTVTFSAAVVAKAMRASAFYGMLQTSPTDKIAASSGTSTAPTSTATATTTQAVEVALGIIVTDGIAADTFTIGGSYTSLTGVFNTTTANVAIYPAYKLLTATAAQTYSATITSRAWAAGVATMKGFLAATATRVATAVDAEVAYTGSGRAASAVSTEVAYVGAGRAASFVGVEVAVTTVHAAVSAVVVEVAYTPYPQRRPSPIITG